MSLLLAVFLLNLAIHLINTLGAATLNELVRTWQAIFESTSADELQLWVLYNKLPTPTAKDAQNSARLKKEVVRLKREMNAVSAQDEFARWAKLRRTHDKAVAEYEKSSMWNPDYALMCKDGILTDATQQPRFKTPKPSSTRRPMFFAGWVQTVCATCYSSGSRVKHFSGCRKAGFLATSNGFSHSPEHPRAVSASSFGASRAPALFPYRAKQSLLPMCWLQSAPT